MEDIRQEVENNISRIRILINQKNEERKMLAREISTLEEEKWKFEDLKNKMDKKYDDK